MANELGRAVPGRTQGSLRVKACPMEGLVALESALYSTPIVLVDTSSTALPTGQAQLAIELRITGVATSGSLTAHEAALVASTVESMLLQVVVHISLAPHAPRRFQTQSRKRQWNVCRM
jgi:hypothetical protein